MSTEKRPIPGIPDMPETFRIPSGTELTLSLLSEFLDKHRRAINNRYSKLQDAYNSRYDIFNAPPKQPWKPDNRICANFPKYAVDTFNGFFIGNPIKVTADEGDITNYVDYIDQYNDQDDGNAELAKICDIHGHGFEMYFTDANAQLCITHLSPMDAFMIFDDSILERPLYFVRRYKDKNDIEYGSVSDATGVRNFKVTGSLTWLDEWQPHYFDGVPATEYKENAERQGLFEPVMSIVNAYNKALSEKANDVDYFADAYLKVLGTTVDGEDIKFIRDNRIANFTGDNADSGVVCEFMEKPSADTTQENLLDRLETLMFQISMIANISDENFGTSSGIALKYKLLAMSNLFKAKERKFTSGMNRRYRLLFSHPSSKVDKDAWVKLRYTFTQNIPSNIDEEAQTAARLEGIVSKETQLSTLSVVENVEQEMERLQEQETSAAYSVLENAAFGQARDDE